MPIGNIIPLSAREGIIGPAMEQATRIRQRRAAATLSEYAAQEAPELMEHRKWGREEEKKTASYEDYKRERDKNITTLTDALNKESLFMGRAQQALSMASTPESFLRTVNELFKDQEMPPIVKQMLNRIDAIKDDPAAFAKEKNDILYFTEDYAETIKLQRQMLLEEQKGRIGIEKETVKAAAATTLQNLRHAQTMNEINLRFTLDTGKALALEKARQKGYSDQGYRIAWDIATAKLMQTFYTWKSEDGKWIAQRRKDRPLPTDIGAWLEAEADHIAKTKMGQRPSTAGEEPLPDESESTGGLPGFTKPQYEYPE